MGPSKRNNAGQHTSTKITRHPRANGNSGSWPLTWHWEPIRRQWKVSLQPGKLVFALKMPMTKFMANSCRWVHVEYKARTVTKLSSPETLRWRHNERDGVSNHQPHDCLLNGLFVQIKENIKQAPRHWPLCGEFTGNSPHKRGNVSIWWRHHEKSKSVCFILELILSHWIRILLQLCCMDIVWRSCLVLKSMQRGYGTLYCVTDIGDQIMLHQWQVTTQPMSGLFDTYKHISSINYYLIFSHLTERLLGSATELTRAWRQYVGHFKT